MGLYSKTESNATTKPVIILPSSCDSCPKAKVSASSSAATSGTNPDMLFKTIGELHDLKTEVEKLKEESKKSAAFYQSATALSNTVRKVVFFMMMIPILQLIGCMVVVYFLGIENELPKLLKLVLSGVSVLSLIELAVGGMKIYSYDNEIKELKSRVDNIQNKC